jgi:hypothetical protein
LGLGGLCRAAADFRPTFRRVSGRCSCPCSLQVLLFGHEFHASQLTCKCAPRGRVSRAFRCARSRNVEVPAGMTCQVHEFDAREGGSIRISRTYDTLARAGRTTPRTDTYHGRFVKPVPNEQIVEAPRRQEWRRVRGIKSRCGQNCPPHGTKSMWHCAESARHAGTKWPNSRGGFCSPLARRFPETFKRS